MTAKLEISLAGKLDVVIGIITVLLRTALTAISYPFSSANRVQPTIGREVVRIFMQRLLDRLTTTQIQWAQPSTTATYEGWIAKSISNEGHHSKPFTELLDDAGAELHWFGRHDAKKIILYFHGGGYRLTIMPGYLSFGRHIVQEVKRLSGVDAKITFLKYTLAPEHTYPTQFHQVLLALQHILASGASPSDVILAGDSAGGQLAFQIASHIMHPHPVMPAIPRPEVPFAGVLPISPWVIFNSTAPTFASNVQDFVSPRTHLSMGEGARRKDASFTGESEQSAAFWREPLLAPESWWRGLDNVTHDILITYGAWEAFAEEIAVFTQKLRKGVAGTLIHIEEVAEAGGIHVGPAIDALMGRKPGVLAGVIAGWVNERFSQ